MKTLLWGLFFTFLIVGEALANTTTADPFTSISAKALNAFIGARQVVFTLGAFTLIAIAVGALFGKINWRWFVSLWVALVILAVAGSIVTHFVNTGMDNEWVNSDALNEKS